VVVIFSVAVLPTGFMESQSYFNWGRRAAQFLPIVIVVSSLNALDQIDAKKHKNVSWKTYSFLKVKLQHCLETSWTKINMIFVQRTVLENSSNQIAGPGVTCCVTI